MATTAELKSVLATDDAGVARLLTTLGAKLGVGRDATIAEVVEELHTLSRVHIVYPAELARCCSPGACYVVSRSTSSTLRSSRWTTMALS
jgi:ABC-type glucose/galactose transport system permease subunit